ncbi:Putative peptidase S10, serine carboxypeptidase, serine carboxypeptidase, serine active [Septoria linicola]|uniref:Carboxypeptidase n=1 Tax=Septoria linicola TaxID=215465 RepID=A0A9Q9APU3_9PEZI|nr:Putative peptidase S10, serine carboxypeptidase, serine carboxypeptidase, serine active [Septoria linicola]
MHSSNHLQVLLVAALTYGEYVSGALAPLKQPVAQVAQVQQSCINRDVSYSIPKRSPSPPKKTFLTAETEQHAVNGSSLPGVEFDIGESYAGVLPISNHADESFFTSTHEIDSKEITIWLQGGPGGGLLLENGPFIWQPGTAQPTRNTFSWTNLTNMVWIDQPVGTRFSVSSPNITNRYELTEQFMGFWKNFIDTFDMHGYKVYLAGESYAGYYIPYIANGFIDANDTSYFNFQGAAINDPIIGNEVIQFEGVAMQYFNHWSEVFGLDGATVANITAQNEKCGYAAYLNKYFQFPPPPAPVTFRHKYWQQ